MSEKHMNVLYELDKLDNYGFCKFTSMSQERGEYIHKNLDMMNEQELLMIISKCISKNRLKQMLLQYELKNWIPPKKKMTLNEFAKMAHKILYRYQSRAGGFMIEDREWTLHKHGSNKYNLKKNEILFENTLSDDYRTDKETREYLFDIISLLNKLSDNITVSLHNMVSERDTIQWLMIKCTYHA